VNFASIAVLEPQAQMASYVAAKAAIAGLTRALALELAPQKIRVNAVAPAAARTADNVKSMGDLPELVPLDALVAAVLYLASDDARAVTGEVMPVTAGHLTCSSRQGRARHRRRPPRGTRAGPRTGGRGMRRRRALQQLGHRRGRNRPRHQETGPQS